MRAERFWGQALAVAARAEASGDLVPLHTRTLTVAGSEPFLIRELISSVPRYPRPEGPRPNPFLPWESALEVARPGPGHVLILNKYPVQPAHLLLITSQWQPQSGWITPADWQSVAAVAADTGGLWFFNSQATAGASQPHRHLQLLPRHHRETSCPLAEHLQRQLAGASERWPWAYALSARQGRAEPSAAAQELASLYQAHALALGLGHAGDASPLQAYNLLFDDDWFLTVRRRREHCAGFSVNALGFAGCLLRTTGADLAWLTRHGPWALLQEVAEPPL